LTFGSLLDDVQQVQVQNNPEHCPKSQSMENHQKNQSIEQAKSSPRKHRSWTGISVGFLISAAALALVLRWAGWESLRAALEKVSPKYLLAALVVYLISMAARGVGWRLLLGGDVGMVRVLAALNEGYLLNNVLPWRLGEIGRAVLLGRKANKAVMGVLSSIFLERLFDIILAVMLLFSLLPLTIGMPGLSRSVFIGAFILVSGFVFLWVTFKRPGWVQYILQRLPGNESFWIGSWDRFRRGLEQARNPGVLFMSYSWIILSWTLAGLMYWLVLRSVIPEAEVLWAYFMLAVTMVGVAVPSSPGYVGVFEAAGVLALSVFSVPKELALAGALILHAIVYVTVGILGTAALIYDGETVWSLYYDVQKLLSEKNNG
jgi:uncharacterized protein (TIRG00374 family)